MADRPVTRASRALWMVNLGFAGITLATVVSVATSTFFAEKVREQTHALVENATESVDLLTRMSNGLNQLHAQVASCVHRGTPEALESLESTRDRTDNLYTTMAGAYDPLANFPHEYEQWRLTHAAVREYFATLDRVITLARAHNTAGAELLVHDALDPTITRATEDAALLVRINVAQLGHIREQIDAAHTAAVQMDGVSGVVVVAILLAVRRLVVRRLTEEDARRARYIDLLSNRNRDLDDFSSRIAHDLKGLVNPVTGYAELLQEKPDDPVIVRQYAGRIARKTDEVVAMVDELLRLSRAGRPSEGPTKPLPVVTSLVEACEVEIVAACAEVVFSVDAPPLACSETALREVVQNLLANAIKYRSPARALRVKIELHAEATMGVLTVTDNGVGMSPPVAARATEPFFRAATEHDVAGSGLGLAIVQRIAEVHGGGLSITSREGHGTTVQVTLPLWLPTM